MISDITSKDCAYFRLSKEDTLVSGQAFTRHKEKLLDLGIKEKDIFWDLESGSHSDREGFLQVKELLKVGKYQRIWIANVERLTRKVIDWETILIESDKYKFEIRVLNRSYDLSTPDGKMVSRFDAIFAQHEWEKNSERSKDAWNFKRRNKTVNRVPFGYVLIEEQIIVDIEPYVCLLENQKELSCYDVARLIIEKFIELGSGRKTAYWINSYLGGTRLGARVKRKKGKSVVLKTVDKRPHRKDLVFCGSGITKWIKHEFLRGSLVYKRGKPDEIAIADNHPPIISKSEWKKIKHNLDIRKTSRGCINRRAHSLTGLVACKNCKRNATITKHTKHFGSLENQKKNVTHYLRCKYKKIYKDKGCEATQNFNYADVEDAIINELCKKYKEITEIATTENIDIRESPDVQKLRQELSEMKKLFYKFGNTVIKSAIEETELKIAELTSGENYKFITKTELRDHFLTQKVFGDPDFYYSLEPLRRGDYFRMFVEKVYISDRIEVILRL